MLKKIFLVLAMVLAAGLILSFIYLRSFSRYHELKQEEERLVQRIQEIDSQIKSLTDEKYLLQNDIEYLEKVVREELGFVKPGEIIYELVTSKNSAEPVVVVNKSPESSTGANGSLVTASATIPGKESKKAVTSR